MKLERVVTLLIFAGVVSGLSCHSSTTIVNPLVRVDFREQLSKAQKRRLELDDISYACHKNFSLEAQGAAQNFVVEFRVLDDQGKKFFTALEVLAEGQVSGATAPQATAVVGEMKMLPGNKDQQVAQVQFRVSFEAQRGCGKIQALRTWTVRADEEGCKPPPALKILRPVQ